MAGVTVTVPATSANLGPGFDCLGLALALRNTVRAELTSQPGWHCEVVGLGATELPSDETNLILRAARLAWHAAGVAPPACLRVVATNAIPLCSGLGSSAAAIIAGLMVGNTLAGSPLSTSDLADLALRFEPHPDNITPALVGGFVAAAAVAGRNRFVRFEPPGGLRAVVATPDQLILTDDSRRRLPEQYDRADVVHNLGHVALLTAGLASGDLAAVGAAMVDRVHEPYRLPGLPGADEACRRAREAGAVGAVLSGSGPSVLALVRAGSEGPVAVALASAWDELEVPVTVLDLDLDPAGALLV